LDLSRPNDAVLQDGTLLSDAPPDGNIFDMLVPAIKHRIAETASALGSDGKIPILVATGSLPAIYASLIVSRVAHD
jgi:hypothetical protein